MVKVYPFPQNLSRKSRLTAEKCKFCLASQCNLCYNTTMSITVEKSRRKTLVLTVTQEGEIVVRAPLGASDAAIEAFVARHRRWIENRLAGANVPLPTLENGAQLVLFGERYTVAQGAPQRRGSTLFLPAENREAALASLLKQFAAAHMGELTRRCATEYGFSYASVRITSARTRWGSCGRCGNIAYSFRTAFLPESLAEYVVVHELCHTRVFNHSAEFWREVHGILPDYAQCRKALRSYRWAMKFL